MVAKSSSTNQGNCQVGVMSLCMRQATASTNGRRFREPGSKPCKIIPELPGSNWFSRIKNAKCRAERGVGATITVLRSGSHNPVEATGRLHGSPFYSDYFRCFQNGNKAGGNLHRRQAHQLSRQHAQGTPPISVTSIAQDFNCLLETGIT